MNKILQFGRKAYWAGQRAIRKTLYAPPAGTIDFGDLRRLTPISVHRGWDRGTPVDRYFINQFVADHQRDIHGAVLEFEDDLYMAQYADHITQRDVVNLTADPKATIIADIVSAPQIPSDSYDCVISTQVLQYVTDVNSAIQTMHRILKPGGVLLCSFPGIAPLDKPDLAWNDQQHLTSYLARRVFPALFSSADVVFHGNVLLATAFFYGIAAEELTPAEKEHADPMVEIVVTVRAVK